MILKSVFIIAIAFVFLFVPNNIFAIDPQSELDRCQNIMESCNQRCGYNPSCDIGACYDNAGSCTSDKLKQYYKMLNEQTYETTKCGTGTHLENGKCVVDVESSICGTGTIENKHGICVPDKKLKGGGCLIATATYGSEMAPQVQQLRELRDNTLLNTDSGTAFMSTFNDIYYSFSPIIADYERENPLFKEAVKLAITPMISSLSLMENANSESEVLGLGISVIALNIGMYLGVPAIAIIGIRKIKYP